MDSPSRRRTHRPTVRFTPSADCFHRVICPLCNGPMTARVGRHGPYFHCLCPNPPARRNGAGTNGNGHSRT